MSILNNVLFVGLCDYKCKKKRSSNMIMEHLMKLDPQQAWVFISWHETKWKKSMSSCSTKFTWWYIENYLMRGKKDKHHPPTASPHITNHILTSYWGLGKKKLGLGSQFDLSCCFLLFSAVFHSESTHGLRDCLLIPRHAGRHFSGWRHPSPQTSWATWTCSYKVGT